MDFALKKAALEQAALLLQGTCMSVCHVTVMSKDTYYISLLDQSLHGQLMEEGFSDDILTLLLPFLKMENSSPTFSDDVASLACPCVRCLCLLATSSSKLRLKLSNDSEFLLGLFKGWCGLHVHRDYSNLPPP